MIHIEGRNISPFSGEEPELRSLCHGRMLRFEMNRQWQQKICDALGVAHGTSCLHKEGLTFRFAPEASMSTNPYPTALFIVRLPDGLMPKQMTDHQALQRGYAKILGQAMERFLNKMRGTDDAKVQVDVELVSGCTGYSTPEKK
ncbi:MAG: hypothetical protein PHC70_01745 [Patescibacteria group bacterium]|nr:hypothetical protein [Patescibacteria group bacterium]